MYNFKLKVTLFFSALMLIQSFIGYALFQQVKDDDLVMPAPIQEMMII